MGGGERMGAMVEDGEGRGDGVRGQARVCGGEGRVYMRSRGTAEGQCAETERDAREGGGGYYRSPYPDRRRSREGRRAGYGR